MNASCRRLGADAGAMNRVASAVGEGSMVVRFAHENLTLT
jgi:hypothetical protein